MWGFPDPRTMSQVNFCTLKITQSVIFCYSSAKWTKTAAVSNTDKKKKFMGLYSNGRDTIN
jgi:hypothetical protein